MAPPRVDYELTALGRDVLVPVTALAMWAFSQRGAVEVARRRFDSQDAGPAVMPMRTVVRAGRRSAA